MGCVRINVDAESVEIKPNGKFVAVEIEVDEETIQKYLDE